MWSRTRRERGWSCGERSGGRRREHLRSDAGSDRRWRRVSGCPDGSPVSELARVAAQWHGELPVAVVHGEVDAANVAEIGVALRTLVTNRSSVLIVDLSPTTYLDSAGINLMFSL